MIDIYINNQKYSVLKTITVLQACEYAGVNIPRFCYHEKLSVAGNCRMCLVEIEKAPKPVAACAMPVSAGMVVFTETPLAKKAREAILEFILINHPLDCPICDQAGECDLQDITLNYGSDRTRFYETKRVVEDKDCGPLIQTIMTRCIHCTRCVRFLTEIAGLEVFGALGRGENMEIGTYIDTYIHTELSGNLVDLCPVGALTSKPYAFLARSWEVQKIESTDFLDALGSNIVAHTRNNTTTNISDNWKKFIDEDVLRILPKLNNEINEAWLSDKARYSHDSQYFNRFTSVITKNSINSHAFPKYNSWARWDLNILDTLFLQILTYGDNWKKPVTGVCGTLTSVEEMFFFFKFLEVGGSSNLLLNNFIFTINIDLPLFYQCNSLIKSIDNADLLLTVGLHARKEASMLNVRIRKNFLNRELPVAHIGTFYAFTYPVWHLGTSPKTLLQIAEGKNPFCKKLRAAKNPLILYGAEFGYRADSRILQYLIRYIGKKSFLNLKNFVGLNLICSSISQTHFCDLGLALYAQSVLYQTRVKNQRDIFNDNINRNVFLFHNIDRKFKWTVNRNVMQLSLNTHKPIHRTLKRVNFAFAITTLYERDSTLINVEGRVQKAFKVITPAGRLCRNADGISRVLFIKQRKMRRDSSALRNSQNRPEYLYFEAPFLKTIGELRKKFYLNFLPLQEFQLKINFRPFKPHLTYFFSRDILSLNSLNAARSQLFLEKFTHFN